MPQLVLDTTLIIKEVGGTESYALPVGSRSLAIDNISGSAITIQISQTDVSDITLNLPARIDVPGDGIRINADGDSLPALTIDNQDADINNKIRITATF